MILSGEKMRELKPCPFCGGKAELNRDAPNGVHTSCFKPYVECTQCTAMMYGSSAIQVVKAWNMRVTDTPQKAGEKSCKFSR